MNVYLCQRCKQPLRVEPDSSFNAQTAVDSFVLVPGQNSDAQSSSNKRASAPVMCENNKEVNFITTLFEYASEKSLIDHPLCIECSGTLLDTLKSELDELLGDKQQYEAYLSSLPTTEADQALLQQYEAEKAELEAEEELLKSQLKSVLEERMTRKQEQLALEQKARDLDNHEEAYWSQFNAFQTSLRAYEQERDALKERNAYLQAELERLNSINAFNDAFHIWHSGHFGMINKCRLGKLPSQPVEWNEINAAWGHAALLLYVIAKKKNYTFKEYKIIPCGSFSKIEKGGTQFPLYGSNSFWNSGFDKAMVGYLTCLKEFQEFITDKDKDTQYQKPYEIKGDTIASFCIRLGNDENWTKALRLMLISLKTLLAYIAKRP